jgi:hypothetical protein
VSTLTTTPEKNGSEHIFRNKTGYENLDFTGRRYNVSNRLRKGHFGHMGEWAGKKIWGFILNDVIYD